MYLRLYIGTPIYRYADCAAQPVVPLATQPCRSPAPRLVGFAGPLLPRFCCQAPFDDGVSELLSYVLTAGPLLRYGP